MRRIPAKYLAALLAVPSLHAAPPVLTQVEPGLEPAIRWKWQVEPSSPTDWGLPVFVPPPAPTAAPVVVGALPVRPNIPGERPTSYVVKRGDALFVIGRRLQVSVDRLKEANGLTTDTIRIGQVLQIPPPDALPIPKPAAPATAGRPAGATPKNAGEIDTLTLQVFLDRSAFSAGPIDAAVTPEFQKLVALFQTAHPDLAAPAALLAKARAAGDPLTTYTLRPEDFRFIAPPKAVPVSARPSATPKRKNAPPAVETIPKPTFGDLTTSRMLAYRSPWEFVAERFHCRERYLRKLNPHITGQPSAGTEFRVPNVSPFAIELPPNPQPPPDPALPTTAAIVDRSRLEISRGGRLLAVLPISAARPGLRGEGSWVVLDAIPRPRLRIRQDFSGVTAAPTRIYGRETPSLATPTPTPAPRQELLAAGPENPVGVLWINLAKSDSPAPLPYGLHGTSIPDEMTTHQSLGGLRLANWDIARAVRLLPPTTPLEWRPEGPSMPVPTAKPAVPVTHP